MPGKIATREEWLEARLALLAKEEAHAKSTDALKTELRTLPMVAVCNDYSFQSPSGPITLTELFGTKSQLIIYHYMFEPTADEGCTGCAFMAANFPDLRHLAQKDTVLVAVSRAPIEKITAFKEKNGWAFPWVSSYGSNFNYDFHVTLDEKVAPPEYDFAPSKGSGEQPGVSVFKLQDGQVYHTYSGYSRIEALSGTYGYLDLTPAGREEGPDGPAEFKLPSVYEEESKKSGD